MSSTAQTAGRPRRFSTRQLLRLGTGAVVVAAVATGIVVVLPTVEAAAQNLVGADPWWVALAAGCEAVSFVAFAALHHRLLHAAGVRVRLREVTMVALAANALHQTVPGGAALSTAYTFKKRREWGASNAITTWTLVAGGVATSLALAAIALGSALVVGGRPTSVFWIVVQVLGVAALGVGTVLVARRPQLLVAAGSAGLRLVNRARRRPRDAGVEALGEQIAALSLIELRGPGRAVVTVTALLNWFGHIACLAASCAAVGADGMTLALVLVAYAAATAASSAALLPGGLGLVDGALLAALVAGGVPSHPALAAVLLYRLISFIGVAIVGWIAWLVVHTRAGSLAEDVADDDTVVEAQTALPLREVGSSAAADDGASSDRVELRAVHSSDWETSRRRAS